MKKTFLLLAAMCCLVINLNAAKLTNVKYIDYNGKEQTCSEATIVENASSQVSWYAGWYVVNSDVTLSEGAKCTGDVHLILMDGKSLTVTGSSMEPGIELPSSYSFTIYGQTNQTGSLSATGGNYAAGIGGSFGYDGGSVTINGGDITVSGRGGIAGGIKSSGEVYPATRITINRGTVNAHGFSSGLYGKEIFISKDLEIKADNNNPPTTVITNSGSDLSSSLNYKQYVTIEASKHTTYTITATATNGTVVGGGEYAPGATVTLGVIPNAGYEFTEWSDGSKDNPYTFTATKDVTLEATCSLKKITVTTSAVNGTVVGGGEFNYGATVTLGAIPNQGYEFSQWSDGATANPYTFTATKNVTLEAVFKEVGDGIEEVHNAQCTMHDVRKVMRDGQLIIIREGEGFNAQGVKL